VAVPRLEIRVDRSACRGAMSCMRRAPGTFSLDDQRKSVVAREPGDPADRIRAAADACPYFAIHIEESEGAA
jgi:ferredoxin